MEGQIDSHQWASKIETHQLISGKPDLEIETEVRATGEEVVGTHQHFEPQSKKHDAERSSAEMPDDGGFFHKICIYLNRHAGILE